MLSVHAQISQANIILYLEGKAAKTKVYDL